MSESAVAGLKVKAAVTNAFQVSNRTACRCASLEVHNSANDLNHVSDDTSHIICKKHTIQEGKRHEISRNDSAGRCLILAGGTAGSRASIIAKLVGAEPGAVIEPLCESCLDRSQVAVMAGPKVEAAREKALASLQKLTVAQLKKKCTDLHLRKKGTKVELQRKIAD